MMTEAIKGKNRRRRQSLFEGTTARLRRQNNPVGRRDLTSSPPFVRVSKATVGVTISDNSSNLVTRLSRLSLAPLLLLSTCCQLLSSSAANIACFAPHVLHVIPSGCRSRDDDGYERSCFAGRRA